MSLGYHSGGLSIELGKQFVRWGKADILNPIDRFAPRDFLTVIDNDFLGITAARITYERGSETIEAILAPRMTPSRVPLQNQRWVVIPEEIPSFLVLRDGGAEYPGGPQMGVRWNHVGLVEFSAAYFRGFNHLPVLDPMLSIEGTALMVDVRRLFPVMRMVGADTAFPLPWFGIKAEAGYFTSRDRRADDYLQYVVQFERQSGEWSFVGGYAGEWIAEKGEQQFEFAPDRGFSETFLVSARYSIDTNRSVALETSIRQNGDGAWTRLQYSQALGQHWRATAHFNLIRGEASDFLGQYRRNSHAVLILRYSF